jgi:hypothetical protein
MLVSVRKRRRRRRIETRGVSINMRLSKFTEKFEKEFSLMIGPLGSNCLAFEDIEVWFVDKWSFSAYDGNEVSFS